MYAPGNKELGHSRACLMAKILLVEDNETFAATVVDGLNAHNFVVEVADCGQDALERLSIVGCDLLLVDWHLPDTSGLDIVKAVRRKGVKTPIIMLTACSSVDEKAEAINAGADDYVTKPFDNRELVARINAALRRASGGVSHELRVGNITLDPVKHTVHNNGSPVHLSPMDFSLLEFMMRNPGQVFSAQVLMSRVWHSDKDASTEGVRTSVRRIRKAIDTESGDSAIENVSRVGYRLRDV